MSLAVLATHMADKGRFGDDMLVHMSKDEVAALQQLAENHGLTLTINPDTGLPEAFSLKKLLGAIAPIALNFLFPGAGAAIGSALGVSSTVGSALFTGGISALATGDLKQGLLTGMMSYGMSGLSGNLKAAAEAQSQVPAAQAAEAAAITSPEVAAQEAARRFGSEAGQQALAQSAMGNPVEVAAAQQLATAPTTVAPMPFDQFRAAEITGQNMAAQRAAEMSFADKFKIATTPEFLKANARNLMMVGLPAMMAGSEEAKLPSGEIDPTKVMFPRKRYNPYTGMYEQLPGFTLADYRKGIMEGRNPLTMADGGIVALAEGGFSDADYKAAGEWMAANINNPGAIAAKAAELNLGLEDLVKAGQTVNPNINAASAAQYFGLSGLSGTSTPQELANAYTASVPGGAGLSERLFTDIARAEGVGVPTMMLGRDILTPNQYDFATAQSTPTGLESLYDTMVRSGNATEADLVNYLRAKQVGVPTMLYGAELVGDRERYLTYNPSKLSEEQQIAALLAARSNLVNTTVGLTDPQFIDFARTHNFTDDILRKAGLLPPIKKIDDKKIDDKKITDKTTTTLTNLGPGVTTGTPPIASVIPGAGPVPTMSEVVRAYTEGGGSLGYIPYAPKSMAELEAKYPITGASKEARDYLYGRGAYPVAQTPEGGIMRPYWEAAGMAAPKYAEKRLTPTGSSSLAGSGEATGSWRGLLAADKMALQNALVDAQQSGDFSPLNALLQAYKLTLADLRQAFPGLTDADIKAYQSKLKFYVPPYVDPIVASGGGGDSAGPGGPSGATGPGNGPGNTSAADSPGPGIGCVDPETLVSITPTETKKAGDIKIGDTLYTVHEKTLEYGNFKVVDARIIRQPKLLVSFDDGSKIRLSDTHKFLLFDNSWKQMFDLNVGAQIKTAYGVNKNGYKTISKIEEIGEGDVVLLTVDEAHTYISDGLISHNIKAKGGLVRRNMGGITALARGGEADEDAPRMISNVAKVANPLSSMHPKTLQAAYDQATKQKNISRQRMLKGEMDLRSRLRNPVVYGDGQEQTALAGGGISHLGDYSDGGRLLKGPGDGVSDDIPATIGNRRPARLADGEFVVPARIVSELGNGSTNAGAKKLYAMMDRIQARRGKTTGKGKVAVNSGAEKLLPA